MGVLLIHNLEMLLTIIPVNIYASQIQYLLKIHWERIVLLAFYSELAFSLKA